MIIVFLCGLIVCSRETIEKVFVTHQNLFDITHTFLVFRIRFDEEIVVFLKISHSFLLFNYLQLSVKREFSSKSFIMNKKISSYLCSCLRHKIPFGNKFLKRETDFVSYLVTIDIIYRTKILNTFHVSSLNE